MPKSNRKIVEVSDEAYAKINSKKLELNSTNAAAVDRLLGITAVTADTQDKLMKAGKRVGKPLSKPSSGIIDAFILYRFWYENRHTEIDYQEITLPRTKIIRGVYNKLTSGTTMTPKELQQEYSLVNINLEPTYKYTWKDVYPVFLSPNLDTRITGNKRFRDEVDNRLKALIKAKLLTKTSKGEYKVTKLAQAFWNIIQGISLLPPHRDTNIAKFI